jgi:hypothetical protein
MEYKWWTVMVQVAIVVINSHPIAPLIFQYPCLWEKHKNGVVRKIKYETLLILYPIDI